MYLDVYGGLPQPHLYQPYRSRRWQTQRSSLKYFVDQQGIEDMVRASVLGGTPSLERVQIPMNHPRKTITPGCIYIECRHAARVRMNKYDRDRWKDRHWAIGRDKVPVGYIDHLQLLARDWLKQFDIALHVGEALFELIRRSDPVVVNRDIDELKRRLLRVIEIGYRVPRPPFIAPD